MPVYSRGEKNPFPLVVFPEARRIPPGGLRDPVTCVRCLYTWRPGGPRRVLDWPKLPKVCPNCTSKEWRRPYANRSFRGEAHRPRGKQVAGVYRWLLDGRSEAERLEELASCHRWDDVLLLGWQAGYSHRCIACGLFRLIWARGRSYFARYVEGELEGHVIQEKGERRKRAGRCPENRASKATLARRRRVK